MSLSDAVALALANDKQYAVAQFQHQAAAEQYPQAIAGLLPSIQGTASTSYAKGQSSFGLEPFQTRTDRVKQWLIQTTQPLFRPASVSELQRAKEAVTASSYNVAKAKNDLIVRTCSAYFDILNAQGKRDAVGYKLKALADHLHEATARVKYGAAAKSDIAEAEARLQLGKASAAEAEGTLESAKATLTRMVGQNTSPPNKLLSRFVGPDVSGYFLDDNVLQVQEDNPEIQQLKHQLESTRYDLQKAEFAHSPTVDLIVSYGSTYATGSIAAPPDISNRSREATVALQLAVPIYTGGAITSKVRQSAAQLAATEAQLDDAVLNLTAQLTQAQAAVVSAKGQASALYQAVKASQTVVDAARVGYRLGAKSNTAVLDALDAWADTQEKFISAQNESIMTLIKYCALSGRLSEDTINDFDKYFFK